MPDPIPSCELHDFEMSERGFFPELVCGFLQDGYGWEYTCRKCGLKAHDSWPRNPVYLAYLIAVMTAKPESLKVSEPHDPNSFDL